MSYKILTPNNSDGTFTFTKEELEKLLDEVYEDGYSSGCSESLKTYWYNNPITNPYTFTERTDISCKNNT